MKSGSVATVGTFDGVHRGHHAVLEATVERARHADRLSLVITFEPHPLEVVNPAAAPPRLTTTTERVEALATSAIDRVVVLRFDRAMASWSPAEFIDRVLIARHDVHQLVIGHDHRFGKGRSGDAATVQALGRARGVPVDVIAPVDVDGHAVSSTAIRRAVAGGDLIGATRQLGRRYALNGTVQYGAQRGGTIGVPTINLAVPPRKLLPPDGVYAVTVDTPFGRFGGMMNQGHRPTFDDGRRLIEVHLLGFQGNLYGQPVRVEWLAHLRDIRRFAGVAELQQQLELDRLGASAAVADAGLDLDAPLVARG